MHGVWQIHPTGSSEKCECRRTSIKQIGIAMAVAMWIDTGRARTSAAIERIARRFPIWASCPLRFRNRTWHDLIGRRPNCERMRNARIPWKKIASARYNPYRQMAQRCSMSRQIIPPLSVVRLARCDRHTPQWKNQIGRVFRVGYYSRQDGTDCVWLVNDAGEYEQTVEQVRLLKFFDLLERSSERALFGRNRPPLPALVPSGNRIRPITKVNGFHRAKSPAGVTSS